MKNLSSKPLLLALTASLGLFSIGNPIQAQNWTLTSAPNNSWTSVASSADGTKLVASANAYGMAPGEIYTSADSGATWIRADVPSNGWSSVASSADGNLLAVAAIQNANLSPGSIYVSVDSGVTWDLTSAPSDYWTSVASTADGTGLLAAGYGGSGYSVYASPNAGVTWTPLTNVPSFVRISSSADGSVLLGASPRGQVYFSTNSGGAWLMANIPANSNSVVAVGVSADGSTLVAAGSGVPNSIYTSTNAGTSWFAATTAYVSWESIACSTNGSRIVAAGYGGIYTSTDSGATWASNSVPNLNWSSVTSSDDGNRLVAVVNGGGIYVYPPTFPVINEGPASQIALAGTNIILAVGATGAGPLAYQWQFNGTNLLDATNDILALTNVVLSESGLYTVLVSNSFSTVVSGSALLTVLPAVISIQPINQTVLAGSNATFNVNVLATVPLAYQWSFNGTALTAETNATLTLIGIKPSDAGMYFVLVSNRFGDVVSSNAQLTVLPAVVSTQPESRTAPAGSTVTFSVYVLAAVPLAYQWTFNGTNLPYATNATLTLTNVSLSNSGTYSVLANNPFGSVVSSNAVLTVLQPVHYERLKSFGFLASVEHNPESALIQGSDGALYGTTSGDSSSSHDLGTVFKLNKNGSGYTALYRFNGSGSDGQNPQAALLQGGDGMLYGTTAGGGVSSAGTVFKLNKDGSGYRILYSFGAGAGDGQKPRAGLMEGIDGALYGTTFSGGTSSNGTVFKLSKDGSGYSVMHHFSGGDDGGLPLAVLVEGRDGKLYGTTAGGTPSAIFYQGTVFTLNKDGSDYKILHTFGGGFGDGEEPLAGLVEGSDGMLYGTTYFGGFSFIDQMYGSGTIFKLNKDGSGYGILINFGSGAEGVNPSAALVEGIDGKLYGTTIDPSYFSGVRPTVFKINKDGSGYTRLHLFSSYAGQGENPPSGLVQGSDGALYGTTQSGGAQSFGMVFKLNRDGSGYTVLRSLAGPAGGDGVYPTTQLVEGSDGALYGSTVNDGNFNSPTVFKVNKDGSGYRTLHRFPNFFASGQVPGSVLVEGRDLVLYGVTYYDGNGAGTVFRMSRTGSYVVLHTFANSAADGQGPTGLMQGSDGILYGVTALGGGFGSGTMFKLNTNGSGYAVQRSFDVDAAYPSSSLVEGSDGALYGTSNGGVAGRIFKLNKDGGGYTVLHNFSIDGVDGQHVATAVLLVSDGRLYGTTLGGGTKGMGTVYRINPDGSGYQVLHNFSADGVDGQTPFGGVVEGSDGALYGTTWSGGFYNGGTVFRVNKDGSGYGLLRWFNGNDTDGGYVPASLAKGGDGRFYGIAQFGGDLGFGTIFRIWPPETPDVIALRIADNTAQFSFAGMSGYKYQVLRSTDLTNWSAVSTITMPPVGVYTNVDTAPPTPAAFYRAAWVPQ